MSDTTRSLTADSLAGLISSGLVRAVTVGVPDQQGRLAGKTFDARHYLDHIHSSGMEMCGYMLATDVHRTPVETQVSGWHEGFSDVTALPDGTTLVQAPWVNEHRALVLADPYRDGTPVSVAPRVQLQQQLTALEKSGIRALAGLEAELVLCDGGPDDNIRALRPAHTRNADYGLDPTPLDAVCSDLTSHLGAADVPLEAIKLEGAPGQVEITCRYGPALQAADRHLVLKHAASHTARTHGMTAAFMAAPGEGIFSGLHIHLSLHQDGRPLLPGDDDEFGLSAHGRHAIAGLLHLMPHLTPLYAPTPNSYRRYRTRSFAPTHYSWGIDNRSVAVRVTGHGTRRHLEIRLPGADAQPHLALAAVLASVRHGLDNKPPLPAPVTGDGYAISSTSTPPLPTDLSAALNDFGDGGADAYISPETIAFFRNFAQHEINALRSEVPDTERGRYL